MDSGGHAYLVRLAKGAALLALGAAAHVWLLPSTHRALESDELVAVAEPAGFAPRQSEPQQPSLIALLESPSDDLAGAAPRSPLAPASSPVPVGTSGRVTVAVENVAAATILDRRRTPTRAERPVTVDAAVAVDTTGDSLAGATDAAPEMLRPVAMMGTAAPSSPTAELQLASDGLSPAQRALRDEIALATPSTTADAPHIAINARQLSDDEQMVRRVLQEYRNAYEQLDAAAAKTVWPTVDERALTHAFQQLASQRLTFRSCGISITGAGANARCRGEAEYLPKVGAKRYTTSGEWVFDLTREQTSWRIVNASVQ